MARVGQIVVVEGPDQGKDFVLDQRQVFEIGRAASSTIQFNDNSVAMNHCRIYREEGNSYTIYDLNSATGTQVNGQSIEKVELNDGDQVKMGNVVLNFKMVDRETKEVTDEDVEGFSLGDFSDSWSAPDGSVDRSSQYAESAQQDQQAQPAAQTQPQPPAGPQGRLLVMEGEDKGKEFVLDRDGKFVIGRALDANIKIMDIKASRTHCAVERSGNQYFVQDQNSRNGTYLNGEKLTERCQLLPGSYLKVGFTVFKFDVV